MDTAGHWIVQGATRSGKTAFIYGVLAQVASMNNVVCRLADPTGIIGLPFAAYDSNSVVPEPASVGNERLLSVADFLDAEVEEMERRIADLSRNWSDKISEATPETPLRLIVVEEFAGIRTAADAEDKVAERRRGETLARIEAALGRLTAEGAKAAIRVVLMTQRASARVVDTDTRGNFAVRITFRIEATESLNMLHDDLGPEWVAAVKKYKNGVGIVQLPGEEIRKFRAGLLEPEESGFEDSDLFHLFTKRILGALELSQSAELERQSGKLRLLMQLDNEEEDSNG